MAKTVNIITTGSKPVIELATDGVLKQKRGLVNAIIDRQYDASGNVTSFTIRSAYWHGTFNDDRTYLVDGVEATGTFAQKADAIQAAFPDAGASALTTEQVTEVIESFSSDPETSTPFNVDMIPGGSITVDKLHADVLSQLGMHQSPTAPIDKTVYFNTVTQKIGVLFGDVWYYFTPSSQEGLSSAEDVLWTGLFTDAGGGIWTLDVYYAVAPSHTIPANSSGFYYATSDGANDNNTNIGLHTDGVNSLLGTWKYGVTADGDGNYYIIVNGGFVGSGTTRQAGDQYGLRRNGDTGVVTAEYKRSGGSWTVMHTFEDTSLAELSLRAQITTRLNNPKIEL